MDFVFVYVSCLASTAVPDMYSRQAAWLSFGVPERSAGADLSEQPHLGAGRQVATCTLDAPTELQHDPRAGSKLSGNSGPGGVEVVEGAWMGLSARADMMSLT